MEMYLNNSYSHMQGFVSGQKSIYYPQKLYIDITEDCNMYCVMCRKALSVCGNTMDINLYKRIIDETAPYVSSYSLFNWGEPLIVKDFCERVLYLKKRKLPEATIDISTNGILLSDDMISFLHENGVIVTVSFDGADKDTFESIRRGGKFEQISAHIRNLAITYKDEPAAFSAGIYTALQRMNSGQLLDIAKLSCSLGVRRMGFGMVTSPIDHAAHQDDRLMDEIIKTKKFLKDQKMLNDLYPTRIGNYVWDRDRFRPVNDFIVNQTCSAPFISASVAFNGDIYLCCNAGELVDNITNKTFREIWLGDRYEMLRKAVNDEKVMPVKCRDCAWFNR